MNESISMHDLRPGAILRSIQDREHVVFHRIESVSASAATITVLSSGNGQRKNISWGHALARMRLVEGEERNAALALFETLRRADSGRPAGARMQKFPRRSVR
jgi:hypothetical protein